MPRKGKKAHTYLTHDQVSALAITAGDLGPLVLVLAYCGLRWGEATAPRVADVDPVRRRFNVRQNAVQVGGRIVVGTPKSHKQRSVPFPASLSPAIGHACADKRPEDLLFPGLDGGYLRRVHGPGKGWFWNETVEAGVPRLALHAHRSEPRDPIGRQRQGGAADARPRLRRDDARRRPSG